ncbi:hypothetical protein ACP275_03G060400 [Erythranthe tilingii]
MKLVADTLTGTLFYVEVKEDATVGDLKRQIADQENLPIDQLILLLDNAQRQIFLEQVEVGLKEHGVKDGSHISVFITPTGEGLPDDAFFGRFGYTQIPDKRSV